MTADDLTPSGAAAVRLALEVVRLRATVAAVSEIVERMQDDIEYDTSHGAAGMDRLERDLRAALTEPKP